MSDLHQSPVTCFEWSLNGIKLFSGDTAGVVVCTEFDFTIVSTLAKFLFDFTIVSTLAKFLLSPYIYILHSASCTAFPFSSI